MDDSLDGVNHYSFFINFTTFISCLDNICQERPTLRTVVINEILSYKNLSLTVLQSYISIITGIDICADDNINTLDIQTGNNIQTKAINDQDKQTDNSINDFITYQVISIFKFFSNFSESYSLFLSLFNQIDFILSHNSESIYRVCMSRLFYRLIISIDVSIIISMYSVCIFIVMTRLGDYDNVVRKLSVQTLRFLFPLAPLYRGKHDSNHELDTNCGEVDSNNLIQDDSNNIRKSGNNELVVNENNKSSFAESADSSSPLRILSDFVLQRATPPSILKSKKDRYIISYLIKQTNLISSDIIEKLNINQDSCIDQNLITQVNSETRVNVNSNNSSILSKFALRSYQWDGITMITALRRCGLGTLLCDDMGLGKTLQALTSLAITRIEKNFETLPSLVVCPATMLLHWKQEIENFFPRNLISAVTIDTQRGMDNQENEKYRQAPKRFYASKAERSVDFTLCELHAYDVVIVSYEMIRQYCEYFVFSHTESADVVASNNNRNEHNTSESNNITNTDSTPVRNIKFPRIWECIILDEAHVIRNHNTILSQCMYRLQGKSRLALTGTPIQNRVEELWSLMHFIIPEFLGKFFSVQFN